MTSTVERLAQIEVRLEVLDEIRDELRALRKDFEADKADLAALKNKGTGLLVGVGIASAFLGAKLQAILHGIAGVFK